MELLIIDLCLPLLCGSYYVGHFLNFREVRKFILSVGGGGKTASFFGIFQLRPDIFSEIQRVRCYNFVLCAACLLGVDSNKDIDPNFV